MLNTIFLVAVVLSILLAAYTGNMDELTRQMLEKMKAAVELAIGLVGAMAFFLGLMKVAEAAGLLRDIARGVSPVMRRLFPGVPDNHPAMSAMILNIGANMLGLANAATPFGIKAMEELDSLNTRKGTATNAMCLFLAINTAGLAILPSGVVSLRTSVGSENPAGIMATTWFASGCATLVGILAALMLSRLPVYRASEPEPPSRGAAAASREGAGEVPAEEEAPRRRPRFARLGILSFWLLFAGLLARYLWLEASEQGARRLVESVTSYWVLPALVGGMLLFGWSRGVRVYDKLVEGAREGFQVALRIIPFLVAILAAVAMLSASGAIDVIVRVVGPLTGKIGLPAEAVPMALLRPLSGSGAFGVAAAIMETHGPDSLIGYMVSTFQGSTETTFYVLAVYFGAVGIRRTRYALPACLLADAAGILAAVFIVNLMFG